MVIRHSVEKLSAKNSVTRPWNSYIVAIKYYMYYQIVLIRLLFQIIVYGTVYLAICYFNYF